MTRASRSYFVWFCVLGVALGPCASAWAQGNTTTSEVAKAATTPLEDIGLKREEIPAPIAAAVMAIYAPPTTCPEARVLISGLDHVLGYDIDAPPEAQKTMWEKGAKAASNLIVDAAKDQATGLVPLRGVVRKLSGAEAHKKAVMRAQMVARARRAFLKGWLSGQGC